MPRYNRIKIVLAKQDKSSSWLAEQVGRNKSTVLWEEGLKKGRNF